MGNLWSFFSVQQPQYSTMKNNQITHFSHPDHPLRFDHTESPFKCDGCKEVGIGSRYRCAACDYDLHAHCAVPSPTISHPFYTKCSFQFLSRPPGPVARYCNACEKSVAGFLYHCKFCDFDLHPCCAKLPMVLDDGELKLYLYKKVSSPCNRSCESRSAATAKLILSNGQLQEFSYPVKVSTLMQRGSANYLDRFICSSDDMEIGQALVAVGGEEELRPGEVYFELPSRWQKHRIQAEDMAALAVKASLALGGGDDDDDDSVSCSCYVFKRVDHAVVVLNCKERPLLAADGGGCGGFKVGKFLPRA